MPFGLGAYSITAVYNGDAGDTSSSGTTDFIVGKAPTTTVGGPSVFSAASGRPLTLYGVVSVAAPGSGSPTGRRGARRWRAPA